MNENSFEEAGLRKGGASSFWKYPSVSRNLTVKVRVSGHRVLGLLKMQSLGFEGSDHRIQGASG